MNYKLQIHFLNDVTTWRAHVPALITMDIIKSPFLHQCSLHSNGNGFKIVQKSFIQSSSNLQEANHLCFSCQQRVPWVVARNVSLLLWLGIGVKQVAFLELWLEMTSLELWLGMVDEHKESLSCGSDWRVLQR